MARHIIAARGGQHFQKNPLLVMQQFRTEPMVDQLYSGMIGGDFHQ